MPWKAVDDESHALNDWNNTVLRSNTYEYDIKVPQQGLLCPLEEYFKRAVMEIVHQLHEERFKYWWLENDYWWLTSEKISLTSDHCEAGLVSKTFYPDSSQRLAVLRFSLLSSEDSYIYQLPSSISSWIHLRYCRGKFDEFL